MPDAQHDERHPARAVGVRGHGLQLPSVLGHRVGMTDPGPETHRPLWRCPDCGQSFTSRNLPHSCQVIGLDELFAGAAPVLRETFERLVAAAKESGPVTVNVTKSRATLQARMRFAGIERPRKAHLVAHLVLTRPLESPRLMRVEPLAPYYHVHWLRLRDAGGRRRRAERLACRGLPGRPPAPRHRPRLAEGAGTALTAAPAVWFRRRR